MKASETRRVVEFLESSVIGRTVNSAPMTTTSADGRVETTYVDQNFFSHLVFSPGRFSFDLTSIAIGRRFGLDSEGTRAELAGSLDAVRLYRYEMTERLSSGQLLGYARFVSSTNDAFDPLAGTVFLVKMWMDGPALVVSDTQVGYGDFPTEGGRRKPIALDGLYRYNLDDGRLRVSFDQATFDVDPETLERTPTGDEFPTQYSEELFDREGERAPA